VVAKLEMCRKLRRDLPGALRAIDDYDGQLVLLSLAGYLISRADPG
jgi:hypothetical protein